MYCIRMSGTPGPIEAGCQLIVTREMCVSSLRSSVLILCSRRLDLPSMAILCLPPTAFLISSR